MAIDAEPVNGHKCELIFGGSQKGLNYSEFDQFEKLGEGLFAKVWKVRHIRDKKVYALKESHVKIKKKGMESFLNKLKEEVELLSHFQHKNIARYHTWFVNDQNQFCILMECCEKDLETYFESKFDIDNIIKPQALKIFGDIICALEYIHGQNVIHRDMKPSNIFLTFPDQMCHAKIGDFGITCFTDNTLTTYTGASLYRAPEQQCSGKYDDKVDIFPCGIVLFELLKINWEDPDDEPQWIHILEELRESPEKVLERSRPFQPEESEQIIHVLLDKDPRKRPSAAEVNSQIKKLTGTQYIESESEEEETSSDFSDDITDDLEVAKEEIKGQFGEDWIQPSDLWMWPTWILYQYKYWASKKMKYRTVEPQMMDKMTERFYEDLIKLKDLADSYLKGYWVNDFVFSEIKPQHPLEVQPAFLSKDIILLMELEKENIPDAEERLDDRMDTVKYLIEDTMPMKGVIVLPCIPNPNSSNYHKYEVLYEGEMFKIKTIAENFVKSDEVTDIVKTTMARLLYFNCRKYKYPKTNKAARQEIDETYFFHASN